MLKTKIREALYGSRLFFPTRSIYQFVFNRAQLKAQWNRRDFYKKFIQPNDLVFDVGANIGVYTECFTELDAYVVAIEPDPSCWHSLLQLAKVRNICVVRNAVGSHPCKRTLHLARESSVSTLVPDRHPDWPEQQGRGTRDVEVLTLDQLAVTYGTPNFVKIDAEGYDDKVLEGMSFRPSALSFEYLLPRLDVGKHCLQILANDGYKFNYTRGTGTQIDGQWISADSMRQQLEALTGEPHYGDVIASKRS